MCQQRNLNVRGVMGYEGHLMAMTDRVDQRVKVRASMETLVETFDAVSAIAGENCTIISAGGTGTFDLYDTSDSVLSRINEVQAGSYALMDSQYGTQGLPFHQAVFVIGTVISQGDGWFVADVGLKSLGMDHGNPTIPGAAVWFCSDEHVTFSLSEVTPTLSIGDRVVVIPAHVDPTVSQHEEMLIVEGRIDHGSRMEAQVVDTWAVDLRGW
jgi:D-serine deaminase-like pyridoxal phosphate-dependent protein